MPTIFQIFSLQKEIICPVRNFFQHIQYLLAGAGPINVCLGVYCRFMICCGTGGVGIHTRKLSKGCVITSYLLGLEILGLSKTPNESNPQYTNPIVKPIHPPIENAATDTREFTVAFSQEICP